VASDLHSTSALPDPVPDVYSDDGVHAASLAACAPAAPGPAGDSWNVDPLRAALRPSSLCVLHGERHDDRVEIRVPVGLYALSGMHGVQLLAQQASTITRVRAGDAVSILLVDVERGDSRALELDELPGSFTTLRWARFATDGSIHALGSNTGREDHRGLVLAVGPASAPLAVHALPPGATTAAMLDVRRGVAAGQNAREVWRTDDGGGSWSPSLARVDGDLAAVLLEQHWERGEIEIRCRGDGCIVGERVVVRWTDDASPMPVPMAANLAPARPRTWTEQTDHGFESVNLRCERSGATLPLGTLAVAPGTPRGARVQRTSHGACAIALATWAAGERQMMSLHVRGRDETGAFDWRAPPATVPTSRRRTSQDEAPEPRVAACARAALAMEWCPGGACDLLAITPRGIRGVPLHASVERALGHAFQAGGTEVTPRGELLVRFGDQVDDVKVHGVVLFGADGRTVWQHVSALEHRDSSQRLLGMAYRGGVWGVVMSELDDPMHLRFAAVRGADDMDAPIDLPRPPSGEIGICTSLPGPDVSEIYTSLPLPMVARPGGSSSGANHVAYELSAAGRMCIRSVGVESFAARATVGGGGAAPQMSGQGDDGAQTLDVRCEISR
ncbi:MAG: hypothetical protein WCJ30_10990, partial [Deltaproteobacteria bacterium]